MKRNNAGRDANHKLKQNAQKQDDDGMHIYLNKQTFLWR